MQISPLRPWLLRHATLAWASEKKKSHSLSRYLAHELVCLHLETLKRLSIFRNGSRNNLRGICVFLKWFITTTVVLATSRTKPFSVEERRKALKTELLRRLLLNASEIHNVRNNFRLVHDTQVSKVALCSVRLNEVDNKEFNSNWKHRTST